MNRLIIYEGNTILITLTITDSNGDDSVLTGFTITLHIKQNKSDIADLLDAEGDVTDNVVVFTIDAVDNDLLKGMYYYEVVAESTDEKYTIVQDRIIVKESIVYVT